MTGFAFALLVGGCGSSGDNNGNPGSGGTSSPGTGGSNAGTAGTTGAGGSGTGGSGTGGSGGVTGSGGSGTGGTSAPGAGGTNAGSGGTNAGSGGSNAGSGGATGSGGSAGAGAGGAVGSGGSGGRGGEAGGGAGRGGSGGGAAGTGGGAGSGSGGAGGTSGGTMTLTSPDQADGAKFGTMYTCAANNGAFGSGVNPELDWANVPAGTMSFAITFIDTKIGANMAMGQHWAAWDIPATARQMPKGTTTLTGMLQGGKQTNKYLAPCPSGNDTYEFTLYALSTATLNVAAGAEGTGTANSAGVAKVLTALQGVTPLATAILHGTSGPMGK